MRDRPGTKPKRWVCTCSAGFHTCLEAYWKEGVDVDAVERAIATEVFRHVKERAKQGKRAISVREALALAAHIGRQYERKEWTPP